MMLPLLASRLPLLLLSVILVGCITPHSHRLDLAGQWTVAQSGQTDAIPATVPGCIHTDLLAAGRIADPFFGDNEKSLQWIGEKDWTFRRSFFVPADLLQHSHLLLRCDGLDTIATIRINDQLIAHTDNMFRTWEFDVRKALRKGDNTIEITFASPLPYIKERQDKRPLPTWTFPGSGYIRKEPCNFGWDWGPRFITCGIWRNVEIVAYDHARIADFSIDQDHKEGNVQLTLDLAVHSDNAAALTADITVAYQQQIVARTTEPLRQDSLHTALDIPDPQLWWPAGMGPQNLYNVSVTLRNSHGDAVDQTSRRIGLRTVQLIPPTKDAPLRLAVNGRPFFAKGANWIPADVFYSRVTPQLLRRYVADAVAVNMNILRLWGGGYYEEDALFDACDEMGLLIWLDFKFACSSYPSFDPAFMDNVREEARDNIRRLRHHPSIAVWCGNNEISLMVDKEWTPSSMGRLDYDKLFRDLLGQQVKELAPQANYTPGSPEVGDDHYWGVWHGNAPFESYAERRGFITEFGCQSFPEPRTVAFYTYPADRSTTLSPVMKHHQRDGKGNEKILSYINRYFRSPKDFDSTLWLSQIMQAYGVKMGVEAWRRDWPNSSGAIIWQYNDTWPTASWAAVDYFGRWKALHYATRHFFAPLLVSGTTDPNTGEARIHVSNDGLQPVEATILWCLTDLSGRAIDQGALPLSVPAQSAQMALPLQFKQHLDHYDPQCILLWTSLLVDGRSISENLLTFARPKDIDLLDPQLSAQIETSAGQATVTLTSVRPALWTWIELQGIEARYSHNFIHVRPNVPAQIHVQLSTPLSAEEFRKVLCVRSLYDTYSHAGLPAASVPAEAFTSGP